MIIRSRMICSLVQGMNRSFAQTIGRSARLVVAMPTAKLSFSCVKSSEVGAGHEEERADEDLHEQLLTRYNLAAVDAHQVFVIQPFKRSKSIAPGDGEVGLKMAESVALADTLNWRVVDKEVVGLSHFNYPEFFNFGKLQELAERVKRNAAISAVFLSTYQLRMNQRFELEKSFGVPVLDRYNVVLQIFQRHCRTKEAKLQVSLAEIQYLMLRLNEDWANESVSKHSKQRLGEDHFEKQDMRLKRRKAKINKSLSKVVSQRDLVRRRRKDLRFPTVAVVGYTNCGKTSLIKALTGDESMSPRNQLFATLDVTVHEAVMPSNLSALFVDTVGFISDIPTNLIASFSATLEDAATADVLVHVRDISNPDHEKQSKNVLETLRRLGVPEEKIDSMITLGNKIDLVDPAQWKGLKERENLVPVSATEGFGLETVRLKTEKLLMEVHGLKKMVFRVRTSSDEHRWLNKNAVAVISTEPEEADANYSMVSVIVSDIDLARFKKTFMGSKR